ncbi:hypothetical protein [Amycolatopsis antarctica]|uniref:hypothetical protein n=1 Tax=Amycolatopsis antarctica TaxID=1854586 RepID=UPI001056D8F1|nr:hypothetical protein [Amycolatopsis antarctica]
MTRSRLLWFVFMVPLTTPLLLAAYREGDLTGSTWCAALATATGIGLVNALLWGKGRSQPS